MTPEAPTACAEERPRRFGSNRWRTPVLIGALAASLFAGWWFGVRPTNAELLRRAKAAFARGDTAEADALASQLVRRSPDSSAALLTAARSAATVGDHERAIGLYDRAARVADGRTIPALNEAGDLLLFEMHRATAAERRFLEVLEHDANNVRAVSRLSHLYFVEGRLHEDVDMIFRHLRAGGFSDNHLIVVAGRDPFAENPIIDSFLKADANDRVPLISRARVALSVNDNLEAERLLRETLDFDPSQIEAGALLGLALFLMGDERKFLDWHESIAPRAESHPLVWLVRGQRAQQRNESLVTIRCFWESVRREPQQKRANLLLGQALAAAGDSQRAAHFLQHAQALSELDVPIDRYMKNRRDVEAIREIAERMESLGRLWEAWGWSRLAADASSNSLPHGERTMSGWAREMSARLGRQLRPNTPLTLDAHRPGLQLDWSAYPLPAWNMTARDVAEPDSGRGKRLPPAFVDATDRAGLVFTYFNGYDGKRLGRRIYEQMGGGVAVLDFDSDGWPDLYFTQGCNWPSNPEQQEHLDCLFRNRGDGTFGDVTADCRIAEWGYGQGVTVGDFNNDAFPDLYVANLGGNRLYENNGDGTFREAVGAVPDNDDWTSSCVLADLNCDGLPDLYDVNFLTGDEIFLKICRNADGHAATCSPDVFSPAQDRLYVNLGDGRFEDRTAAAGVNGNVGNGLGVVAADFDGSGLLSLFIANDQTANFFFHPRSTRRGEEIDLEERGVATGLGFDRDGLALACMGVAAGDADGDGSLDLFVTNFSNESNVLYLRQPGLWFVDATQSANLRDGSFKMLGFGTQFLDGELDGVPDLVLTNGHVDHEGRDGSPYRMRPQYYRNLGGSRFAELPPEEVGPFFGTPRVGRGLALLDWNRDGRAEFAVSHLDSPAALLENTTSSAGHFLAVRLVGTDSSRDAIGATATVTAGRRRLTHQLTAGDGYQASNQRQLVFGLDAHDGSVQIEVCWPSGFVQEVNDLPADAEYMIVEGHPAPFQLPR